MPDRRRRLLRQGVVLLLAVTAALGAVPARAAVVDVRDVRITQDGPVPDELDAAPGDVVRLVNDDTFVHRVVGTSPGWRFDTGPLLPRRSYTVEEALPAPGRYVYRGAGLDTYVGSVLVAGSTTASPAPTPAPSLSPSPPVPTSPSPVLAEGGPSAPAASPGPGRLSNPVGARRYGLPAVLALVAALGTASLLVRVLLAEPREGRPGSR